MEEEQRVASLTEDRAARPGSQAQQTHQHLEKIHSIRLTKIFINSLAFRWQI